MIRKIVVRNPKDELLELILSNPDKSGINIMNITGITPIGADIFITPFASIDGGIFSGARVPSRNIVFTLGMLNNPKDAENSRHKVYNFFRIKDPVNLVFHTDERILQIDGYVESVDGEIFSEQETLTVSIICVNPWFRSISYSNKGFSGVTSLFEFPFHSDTFFRDLDISMYRTKPEHFLEFGNISIDTRTDIFYDGDIKVGFNINMSFLGDNFHNIYIYNMDTRERLDLYTDQIESITGSPLTTGDEIHISTVSGNKSVYLLRNGEYTNVISMVDKNATWFQLTKGNNVLAFSSDYGVDNIVMTVTFENAYGGI